MRNSVRGVPVQRSCAAALLAVVLLMTAPHATAQVVLPDMGDSAGTVMSGTTERLIGEAFMREVRSALPIVDDPEIDDYINNLGFRLASHSERRGQHFTFFVVDNGAINAFAGPGGYIGVHTGLILAARSESELAAVMAHEIAHVTQRHIARAYEMADRNNLPAMAGMLAAIILGTQNAQMGSAAMAAVSGAGVQAQLDFTRANEKEADRVGIQLLASAGLDPRSMPTFFEQLQQSQRYYREPPEFLSTHPVTTSRIADSRNRAESYPYRQFTDSQQYQLVRAKLEVLASEEPAKTLRYFQDRLDSEHYDPLAARYGYALSLATVGELDRARDQFKGLVRHHPENIPFHNALARVELASGNLGEALRIYGETLEIYPDSRLLVRGYADALIKAKKPADTLDLLAEYQRYNTLDSTLYRIQAAAFEQTGNKAKSHASLAESYYINGQVGAAVHQLRLAVQTGTNDFYENSRMEARLSALETEQQQRVGR